VRVAEHVAQVAEELGPLDQAATHREVQEADHIGPAQVAQPCLEALQLALGMDAADEGADRRATDDVGPDAGLLEHLDRADVRPAACRAATQRQPDAKLAWPAQHARSLRIRFVPGGVFHYTSGLRASRDGGDIRHGRGPGHQLGSDPTRTESPSDAHPYELDDCRSVD